MHNYYVSKDMRFTYLDLLNDTIKDGQRVAPRKQATYELHDVTIQLNDPTRAVPYGVGRKLNMAIASAEFVQLVGGYSDIHQLAAITPRFLDFTDDGRLQGAYGPRLFNQWEHVITKLRADKDTRQAVLPLWRPDELLNDSRDVPCTVSLGFFIRDDLLHMKTHMRSNDLWTGLPYDFAVFTALQRTLAPILNLQVGTYTHYVWSLHLYERDVEAALKLNAQKGVEYRDLTPPLSYEPLDVFSSHSSVDRWRRVSALAREVGLYQRDNVLTRYDEIAVTKDSYVHYERLKEYQPNRGFCKICRYTYDDYCRSTHTVGW